MQSEDCEGGMKLEEIKKIWLLMDMHAAFGQFKQRSLNHDAVSDGAKQARDTIAQLLKMVGVSKKALERLNATGDPFSDVAAKALTEMKRLEDDPLKQLVQEAQEMGMYDPPKGDPRD